MNILFNDVFQDEPDIPIDLKGPTLSKQVFLAGTSTISYKLENKSTINSIGFSGSGSFLITIYGTNKNASISFQEGNFETGLYLLPHKVIEAHTIEIKSLKTELSFISRIAAGIAVNIPTAVTKEPGFCSTAIPRKTLSGQIIHGLGGYIYRTVALDSRYKIDSTAINELKAGYNCIGKGYPFFLDFSDEAYKLPFTKLYAIEKNQRNMVFQSGVRKYLYSLRFEFEECF